MILDVNSYDPNKTKKQILPYKFDMLPNGKLRIVNTRSQVLMVTKTQVRNALENPELDVHRRKMYEAALVEFGKVKKVQ